jgi:hypothetical protein
VDLTNFFKENDSSVVLCPLCFFFFRLSSSNGNYSQSFPQAGTVPLSSSQWNPVLTKPNGAISMDRTAHTYLHPCLFHIWNVNILFVFVPLLCLQTNDCMRIRLKFVVFAINRYWHEVISTLTINYPISIFEANRYRSRSQIVPLRNSRSGTGSTQSREDN